MSSTGTSGSSTPSSRTSEKPPHQFIFVDDTRKDDTSRHGDVRAQKKSVRAQAAKASSQARLETIRKRAEVRNRDRNPGQGVFAVQLGLPEKRQQWKEPLPKVAVKQHENAVAKYQARESAVAVHSDTILGGAIPAAQANIAILGQFLGRFSIGASTERPWVELVLDGASSRETPGMMNNALRANATAMLANDLQSPHVRQHATQLYLSTIKQLQSSLNGPKWNDPIVMYTCMISSLFEIIQSNNPVAAYPHVRGVAHLIQQKGPQTFTSGLEHKTFRYYRINLCMVSLADARTCFLEETEWKTIPFSGDCPPKTVMDRLIDVLVHIPGVLAIVESMKAAGLSHSALVKKGLELAYSARCLVQDLERWKQDYIWTHPRLCATPYLRTLSFLELCKLVTGLHPYDYKLGEALNCYAAAHCILGIIAHRVAQRSWLAGAAVRAPHSLHDLVAAIALISDKHTSSEMTGMVSMMVTAFPLKVAQGTHDVQDPVLSKSLKRSTERINHEFARRYNINYSVPKKPEYEV